MNKRLLTKRQEEIFKLCHHDFEGLSQTEAAERLGISQKIISIALKRIKKVAPQLFPILTKLEAKAYHYFMDEGWGVTEIAEYLNSSEDKISNAIRRAKDKKESLTTSDFRIVSYDDESMAHLVKHKF